MNNSQSFTEGRIFSPLIRFALPILLALFLQAMYGAVDLLVVGQFGGELADPFSLNGTALCNISSDKRKVICF